MFRLIKAFFKRVKFFQCYIIFLSILSTILNADVMPNVVRASIESILSTISNADVMLTLSVLD